MRALVYAGLNAPLAAMLEPETLEATLRQIWFYVPDGRHETIRTVQRMTADMAADQNVFVDGQHFGRKPAGMIAGDCDDAAIVAAAVLLRARMQGNADIGRIYFVGARPPASIEFQHVFTIAAWRGDILRIDPTAPADADYASWEKIAFEV